jgi:Rrf2 family protein
MIRGDAIFNALHLLAHLAATPDAPQTSEHLAKCLQTNPVVIRRALADLRRSSLVHSAPGHGGGWTLARPAGEITVQEVYAALGAHIWAAPEAESPACALEAAVNHALTGVYQDIEVLLSARLQQITLADLGREMVAGHGTSHGREVRLHER